MKHSEIYMAIIILLMGVLIWTNQSENRELVDAHHKYVRQQELNMADMKSRMAALESVDISVNIVDHTGIYSVMGMEVK